MSSLVHLELDENDMIIKMEDRWYVPPLLSLFNRLRAHSGRSFSRPKTNWFNPTPLFKGTVTPFLLPASLSFSEGSMGKSCLVWLGFRELEFRDWDLEFGSLGVLIFLLQMGRSESCFEVFCSVYDGWWWLSNLFFFSLFLRTDSWDSFSESDSRKKNQWSRRLPWTQGKLTSNDRVLESVSMEYMAWSYTIHLHDSENFRHTATVENQQIPFSPPREYTDGDYNLTWLCLWSLDSKSFLCHLTFQTKLQKLSEVTEDGTTSSQKWSSSTLQVVALKPAMHAYMTKQGRTFFFFFTSNPSHRTQRYVSFSKSAGIGSDSKRFVIGGQYRTGKAEATSEYRNEMSELEGFSRKNKLAGSRE